MCGRRSVSLTSLCRTAVGISLLNGQDCVMPCAVVKVLDADQEIEPGVEEGE